MAEPVRVLLMEDDPVTTRIMTFRLEEAGFAVEPAVDGNEGMQKCDEGDFEIALIDKNMPELDGLDVIRKLGRLDLFERPSLIMVTASGDEAAAVEAMKSGASNYIVKDPQGDYLELLPTVIDRTLNERLLEAEKRRVEEERERLIKELQEALAEVKKLSGMLPICMHCKKIRDDDGYWEEIDAYVRTHSEAEFSHGLCPNCAKELYPDVYTEDAE